MDCLVHLGAGAAVPPVPAPNLEFAGRGIPANGHFACHVRGVRVFAGYSSSSGLASGCGRHNSRAAAGRFAAVAGIGLILNAPLMMMLIHWMGPPYMAAQPDATPRGRQK
jgi:hypothetical protein